MAVQQDQSLTQNSGRFSVRRPADRSAPVSLSEPVVARMFAGTRHALLVIAAALLCASPLAQAQQTSGSAATGATLWTGGNCTGCHGATPTTFYNAPKNAANAGGVILNANNNFMGGLVAGAVAPNATQRADLAAYIATFVPAPSSANVPYNSGAPAPAATPILLDHIYLGTTYGAFTSLQTVNANSASISYTGTTANYTAPVGACGSTSFTYEGAGPAGTSSVRSQPITITAPTAPVATGNSPAAIAYNSAAGTNIPLLLSGTAPTSLTIISQPAVGTVATTGSNTIAYTASASAYSGSVSFQYRANGPCSTQSATVTVNLTINPPPAPVITSSLTPTATGGQAFNYTLTASNAPTAFTATGLPTGLSFNAGTQVISGTPTQTGVFNVAVSATNVTGTTMGTVVLTVNLVAPVITSSLTANATSGAPFTYTITANNLPASFNATGLPTGLSINTTTGLISGTPVVAMGGPVNVTISATNATNTDSKILVLTVSLNPPTFTSATTASGNATQAFTFNVTASDFPTSYAATGLPPGLTINTTTGVISGTPTTPGVYNVMLTATNGSGSTPQTLTITINLLAPVVTSAGTASGTVSTPFTYQITASNLPASFNATGLPPGLSVNTATGLISGTPTTNGTFNTTISATNATNTGTQPLVITIANLPPPSVGGSVLNVPFGGTGTVDLAGLASGAGPFTYAIATQPTNGTATLSGSVVTYKPNNNFFGNDSFAFTVTGSGGTSSPAQVSVTVATPGAPTVAAKTVTVAFNTTTTIDLTASVTGIATSIAISTPPTGGTVTVNGRIVTYKPNAGYFGPDSFSYTATGPGGTSMPAEVSITVATQPPAATTVRFILPLNTPTTMDMGPFITGSAISGVSIVTQPKHGEATVNGTKITYKPNADFFGDDVFTYAAYGNAGTSPPATVNVSVVGRPDPTRNANVGGVIAAQADSAQRFARAQISNFQSRMESLHRAKEISDSLTPPAAAAKTSERAAPTRVAQVTEGIAGGPTAQSNMRPVSTADATTPIPLLGSAVALASSGSVSLASLGSELGAAASGGKADAGALSLWMAGNANFGSRMANGTRSGSDFTTSGVSIGMDKRISNSLALGFGMGFARDRTDVGSDGSNSRAKGYSAIGYGSYQPGGNLFVDALIGAGALDFTSKRYVTPLDAYAQADRKGRQVFGSLAAGLETRDNGVLLSPYGRIDYTSDRLKEASESGAGSYALTYFSQTTPSLQAAVGFRAESIHLTDFGAAAPRIRAEYRREFQGSRDASVAYADLAGSSRYGISAASVARNALVVGVGSDFQFRTGLTLGVDYQVAHNFNRDTSQGLRLTLTQPLDGRSSGLNFNYLPLRFAKPVDIIVDAGYMYDTNVTRGKERTDKRGDRVYSVNASKGFVFNFEDRENLRANVEAQFSGEKFDTYRGLDRALFGMAGDIKYRTSAEFDAVTYAAFTQAQGEYVYSTLRRGYRFNIGVSARQQVTDKIGLFGAVSFNQRWARSSVFDNQFGSIRLNADYALNNNDTVYLTGEYRRGHIVSTGAGSLENLDIAEVFVADDAYPGTGFQSYRVRGNTYISTLGYNMGFGPRHSLDLSWRRAQSTPNDRPAFATSPKSYIADQYSIVYLIRF